MVLLFAGYLFFKYLWYHIWLGFSEAGLTPIAISLLSDVFEPQYEGLVLGVFNRAIYTGYSLAYIVGNFVYINQVIQHGSTEDIIAPWWGIISKLTIPFYRIYMISLIHINPCEKGCMHGHCFPNCSTSLMVVLWQFIMHFIICMWCIPFSQVCYIFIPMWTSIFEDLHLHGRNEKTESARYCMTYLMYHLARGQHDCQVHECTAACLCFQTGRFLCTGLVITERCVWRFCVGDRLGILQLGHLSGLWDDFCCRQLHPYCWHLGAGSTGFRLLWGWHFL